MAMANAVAQFDFTFRLETEACDLLKSGKPLKVWMKGGSSLDISIQGLSMESAGSRKSWLFAGTALGKAVLGYLNETNGCGFLNFTENLAYLR